MDWTKRVGELHGLVQEYYENETVTADDYDTPQAYIDELASYIFESESLDNVALDADEQRVVRNELERIVGTA